MLKEYEKTDVKYGIYCGLIRKKEIGNLTELTEYMSNPPPLPTSIHQKLFHMNTTCLFHIKRRKNKQKEENEIKRKKLSELRTGWMNITLELLELCTAHNTNFQDHHSICSFQLGKIKKVHRSTNCILTKNVKGGYYKNTHSI